MKSAHAPKGGAGVARREKGWQAASDHAAHQRADQLCGTSCCPICGRQHAAGDAEACHARVLSDVATADASVFDADNSNARIRFVDYCEATAAGRPTANVVLVIVAAAHSDEIITKVTELAYAYGRLQSDAALPQCSESWLASRDRGSLEVLGDFTMEKAQPARRKVGDDRVPRAIH